MNLEDILISIIIPVYNIENYIHRCINSILVQTHQRIEIIAVDDGSTDNSGKILDELGKLDDRIKIIHKKNGGVTSARLDGIKKSQGEYIGFVDGDDYIEKNMYESLLANAVRYRADISHCGYQMVFPNRVDYYYNSGEIIIEDNHVGLKDLLEGKVVEPGLCNKLYKKDLIATVLSENQFDDSIKINEDLLMNYYLFKKSKKSVFEDKCYYHYMVRSNSAATSEMNKYKLENPIRVMKIICKDIDSNNELYYIAKQRLINLMITIITLSKEYNENYIKDFKKIIHKELLKESISIISSNEYGVSLKLKTIFASITPKLYDLIHKLYIHITGLDKKYIVE